MLEVPPTEFGDWTFDRDNLTLWLASHQYEVDLEQCLSPADAFSWLIQVGGKAWGSASILGDLVKGLAALLYAYDSPHSISAHEARSLILENERKTLAVRRYEERSHELSDPGELAVINLGDAARLEAECRAEVDAAFEAADRAEITKDLLPSGLAVGDVYAIGLVSGDCPVGRVGRGYGPDEIVVYLFDWLTGTFGTPKRIEAAEIADVRHAVLMTDEQKASAGYPDDAAVFDMDPLAEFQNHWKTR